MKNNLKELTNILDKGGINLFSDFFGEKYSIILALNFMNEFCIKNDEYMYMCVMPNTKNWYRSCFVSLVSGLSKYVTYPYLCPLADIFWHMDKVDKLDVEKFTNALKLIASKHVIMTSSEEIGQNVVKTMLNEYTLENGIVEKLDRQDNIYYCVLSFSKLADKNGYTKEELLDKFKTFADAYGATFILFDYPDNIDFDLCNKYKVKVMEIEEIENYKKFSIKTSNKKLEVTYDEEKSSIEKVEKIEK